VVGSSAVAIIAIGGDKSMASLPLGAYFLGGALIGFGTPVLFNQGRKIGFLRGLLLGCVVLALGVTSVMRRSPALFILSQCVFGMSSGIGFYMRFAAVEVIPAQYAPKAVAWVVSGGCLAAFAGPESALATQSMFPSYPFLGNFVVLGIFYVANLCCLLLIQFPPPPPPPPVPEGTTIKGFWGNFQESLVLVMHNRNFLLPLAISAITWACMGMPMAMVRVVMQRVGYSPRQSLTVMEMHFLGMYVPGFVTGNLIKHYGPMHVCFGSIFAYAIAVCLLLLVQEKDNDNNHGMALWSLGLTAVGVAWSLGFTASSVYLLRVYATALHLRSYTQGAHDALMFFLAGGPVFASSYIVRTSGEDALEGWRTLISIVAGLVTLSFAILLTNYVWWEGKSEASVKKELQNDDVESQ
jgi:hypothetical protein